METTESSQRRPVKGAKRTAKPDRREDRLLQLLEMSEITTIGEATLRWLRHRGEGPPMFRLGRRLVCWETDLHKWIEAQAREDAARAS